MGWFSQTEDQKLENLIQKTQEKEELSEKLQTYIENEAMKLYRTFRSEWNSFQRWLKMPLWEKVLSNMTIDNISLQPFFISLVRIEDILAKEYKNGSPNNTETYKVFLRKEIEDLINSPVPLSSQKIANIYKNVFLLNIEKESTNSAKKLLQELALFMPSSPQTAIEAEVIPTETDDVFLEKTEKAIDVIAKKKKKKKKARHISDTSNK